MTGHRRADWAGARKRQRPHLNVLMRRGRMSSDARRRCSDVIWASGDGRSAEKPGVLSRVSIDKDVCTRVHEQRNESLSIWCLTGVRLNRWISRLATCIADAPRPSGSLRDQLCTRIVCDAERWHHKRLLREARGSGRRRRRSPEVARRWEMVWMRTQKGVRCASQRTRESCNGLGRWLMESRRTGTGHGAARAGGGRRWALR